MVGAGSRNLPHLPRISSQPDLDSSGRDMLPQIIRPAMGTGRFDLFHLFNGHDLVKGTAAFFTFKLVDGHGNLLTLENYSSKFQVPSSRSSCGREFYPSRAYTSTLLTCSVSACNIATEGMEEFLAVYMEKPNGDGWAHLVSDQHGEKGRTELLVFLKKIGVRRSLHRARTYAEHCDIRGTEIALAGKSGAVFITRRELARLLRDKRARQETPGTSSSMVSDF